MNALSAWAAGKNPNSVISFNDINTLCEDFFWAPQRCLPYSGVRCGQKSLRNG
jgi:hypothetical protein